MRDYNSYKLKGYYAKGMGGIHLDIKAMLYT